MPLQKTVALGIDSEQNQHFKWPFPEPDVNLEPKILTQLSLLAKMPELNEWISYDCLEIVIVLVADYRFYPTEIFQRSE